MRQGRHSRSRWDWGTEPSRSDERAAAIAAEEAEPKGSPGKKDKNARCKVAKGPHRPMPLERMPSYHCQWILVWQRGQWITRWWCVHEIKCEACGRIFQARLKEEQCPRWKPISEEQVRSLKEQASQREEAQRKWRSRKPTVTGRQSYRRPKKV